MRIYFFLILFLINTNNIFAEGFYDYYNQGIDYVRDGQYEEAIEILNNAKNIASSTEFQSEKEKNKSIGSTYALLGVSYYQIYEYFLAIKHLTKGIEILKNVDDYHKGLMSTYKTLLLSAKAKVISFEAGNETQVPDESWKNLSTQASSLFYDGKYMQAIDYAKKALIKADVEFDKNHVNYALSHSFLGFLYHKIGDFEKAEPLMLEGLRLYQNVYPKDEYPNSHPSIIQNFNNLVSMYVDKGNIVEAEKYAKKAMKFSRKLFPKGDYDKYYNNGSLYLAVSLGSMAGVYFAYGLYSKAEPLLLEGLKIYQNNYQDSHKYVILFASNLGQLYDKMNNPRAEEYLYFAYQNAKKHYSKEKYPDGHPDFANRIANLGSFYRKKGKFEKAEPLLKEALAMRKRVYSDAHADVVYSLVDLADLYDSQEKYDKANSLYLEALEMNERLFPEDHLTKAIGISNYGVFLSSQKKLIQAKNYWLNSLDMLERIYKKNSIILSQKEREKYWQTIDYFFQFYFAYLFEAYEKVPGLTNKAMDYRLFSKGLLLRSSLMMRRLIHQSGDDTVINMFEDWRETRIKINSIEQFKVKKDKHIVDLLDSLNNAANTMEKELYASSNSFATDQNRMKYNCKDLQKALKPNEAAVEIVRFWLTDETWRKETKIAYAALIVKPESDSVQVVFIENGNELEGKFIDEYQTKMNKKNIDFDSYSRFWSPFSEKLEGYEIIYFSPDGVYNEISLNTLINAEDKRFLMDEKDIRIVGNLGDIIPKDYGLEPVKHLTASLYGNPDYSLSADKHNQIASNYSGERSVSRSIMGDAIGDIREMMRATRLLPLPGTEKEVNTISKYLISEGYETTVKKDENAVEAAVKSEVSPTILHIATHGHFLEIKKNKSTSITGFEDQINYQDPLKRSFLCFAGADATLYGDEEIEGDDGLLTAKEAMEINLINTELVVLSACKTGVGEARTGEGVYGLQRAFIEAGADALIMSLWNVPDKRTQELMGLFYDFWLDEGLSKRDAFNKAQNTLKAKGLHPFFWGAFVFISKN